MAGKKAAGILAGLLCVLPALALWAQKPEKPPEPQFVLIYQDTVKPGALKDYESAVKDMVALLKEEKADSPAFLMWAYLEEGGTTFSYATPMHAMADMDAMYKDWMELMKGPDKAKWEALVKRMSATLACTKRSVAVRNGKASCMPAEPRVAMKDAKYRYFEYLQVIPGKEKEFVAACKGLADITAKVGSKEAWMTYEMVVGGPMPTYVISTPAKGPEDFRKSQKEWRKAVGDEGGRLIDKILSVTKRYTAGGAWIRHDLSYVPPSMMKHDVKPEKVQPQKK